MPSCAGGAEVASSVDVQVRLRKETDMEGTSWVMRWRYLIAPKPSKPGVWRRKEGGYLVRGRVKEFRTGKLRDVMRIVNEVDAAGAYRILQEELHRIRTGAGVERRERIRFSAYAALLFERKLVKRQIRSAKGREKWDSSLRLHLIPAFGDVFIDAIRRSDIEGWLAKAAKKVEREEYSPATVNGWLALLRLVLKSAVAEYQLPLDPTIGVEELDTTTHHTYTEEEPNALTVAEVPRFLAEMRRSHPNHFAMTALGFATGLRPSSLRPLR
jgi:hypothetical protein